MAASSNHPETMRATRSLDNSEVCYPETSVPALLVTLLGGEWSSSAGGLSTINRELAIHLSNHSAVEVSLLVPEGACNHEEKNEARAYGITIVEAKRRAAFDRLVWLNSPPKDHVMDIVVGHGVKLGRQVQFIRDSARFPNCKWVQVVHTAPEDLSRYKCYSDPISKGETKHESEVELCKLADLVVPVGPRLKEAYTSYLQRCKTDQDVLSITPGLFQREFGDLVAKQVPNEDGELKVLLFGRGDHEDFELKGYNIAAQAFTDQRLKNKPYHLIFVGAPERKQEEVRGKLLQRGIAEAQLTVRKFIQSRDRLKDLLCEADLAIMPSKSEGFGLVALEALSAGLPILVGSRSGFARALENVPHGNACIVNSDDPAEWAKAIEAVRIRHGMTLQEIKSVRTFYGEIYSWKEQCDTFVNRMRRLGRDASHTPKDVSVTEKQSVAKTYTSASGFSEDQSPANEETKTEDAICHTPSTSGLASDRDASDIPKDVSVTEKQSVAKTHTSASVFSEDQCLVNEETKTEDAMCHTPNASGLASDRDAENTVKMSITARDLSSELVDVVDRMLRQQLQWYLEYNKKNKLSTASGLSDFFKHLEKTYNFTLTSVGEGSLVIKGQCPDLQSLESLWNDYCSGVLNEAAERCLVTDDVKKEINSETLRLTTIIKEESYLTCRKALMEKSVVRPRYHPGTDFVYNMTARPRGITLIINNTSFAHHNEHGKQSARHGSEEDVSQVKTLFAALDFSVRTKQDLSKQQLMNELSDVVYQDHSAYDCFVLWLMCYGRSGEVFCSDGYTIAIQTLDDMFSVCKTLSGKPKLFFIQACRGIGEDEGVVVHLDYDNPASRITKGDSVVPRYSDFLYAFSTVDEYVSYRNENEGSHYVRCFVEAIREHVAHDHILDILTVVNHEVSKINTQRPSWKNRNRTKICKQIPEVRHTLRKKVRF